MRNYLFTILSFLTLSLVLSCDSKKNSENETVTDVTELNEVVEEEDVESPPPGFTSRFSSIDEWLTAISNSKGPDKAIATYNIVLFETEGSYILSLTGVNTYETAKDRTSVRIEFNPPDTYFNLPQTQHKGLNRDQTLEILNKQVKQFIASEKFKNSFLSKATTIETSWTGKPVWTWED